jgi:hypothetical protein
VLFKRKKKGKRKKRMAKRARTDPFEDVWHKKEVDFAAAFPDALANLQMDVLRENLNKKYEAMRISLVLDTIRRHLLTGVEVPEGCYRDQDLWLGFRALSKTWRNYIDGGGGTCWLLWCHLCCGEFVELDRRHHNKKLLIALSNPDPETMYKFVDGLAVPGSTLQRLVKCTGNGSPFLCLRTIDVSPSSQRRDEIWRYQSFARLLRLTYFEALAHASYVEALHEKAIASARERECARLLRLAKDESEEANNVITFHLRYKPKDIEGYD